jgi:aspartyl-tRNA(Asn)/glutamyl-tRNA(Gln) amidotransferase subunit C
MTLRISESQVSHISHLARLKLTAEEIALFGAQLADILNYMDQLNAVNTDGIEPTAHALPLKNVFRDDVPAQSFNASEALANAPEAAPPYFKVPKVLDQDSA